MSVSQEEFERVHDGLYFRYRVHMAEKPLRRILDVALEDRVPAERLQERYDAGKRRMRKKHADLSDATLALTVAREFIESAVAWQGSESYRDETLERLDKAIAYFTP